MVKQETESTDTEVWKVDLVADRTRSAGFHGYWILIAAPPALPAQDGEFGVVLNGMMLAILLLSKRGNDC